MKKMLMYIALTMTNCCCFCGFNNNEEILQAIRDDNENVIEETVLKDPSFDLNQVLDEKLGLSALALAIHCNSKKVFNQLLQCNRVDPNQELLTSKEGLCFPLLYACAVCNGEDRIYFVKKFLDCSRVDVNKIIQGYFVRYPSAISYVAKKYSETRDKGFFDLLQLFLKHQSITLSSEDAVRAMIEEQDKNGDVSKILDELSDIDQKDLNKSFEGEISGVDSLGSKLNLLLNKKNIHFGLDGETPLTFAINNGRAEIFKFLLTCPGIDVNMENLSGVSPLFCALNNDNDGYYAKMLLEHPEIGVDKISSKYGCTAIQFAIKNDKKKLFEVLLECPKVNLSMKALAGFLSAYVASSKNKVDFYLEKIFEHKNFNSLDALWFVAFEKEHCWLVPHLLDKCNVDLLWKYEGTSDILEVLKSQPNQDKKIKKIIAQIEQAKKQYFLNAIINDNTAVVGKYLKDATFDPNQKFGNFGETALHWAVSHNLKKVFELLLACDRIDVNRQDVAHQASPIFYAANCNNDRDFYIDKLLNHIKFDSNVTYGGYTPQEYIKKQQSKDMQITDSMGQKKENKRNFSAFNGQ